MADKSLVGNLINSVKHHTSFLTRKRHPAALSWFQQKKYKHLTDAHQKTLTVNGLFITYRLRHTLFYTYPEIFLREIYRFSPGNERPVILDCGANIGISTLYFARTYPDAAIIAFEPDDENYEILEKNIKDNGFAGDRVQLVKKAIWTNNDGIRFHAEGTEGSKILTGNSDATAVFVRTERLKDLLMQYSVIDFLKLDIEGAEYAVIMDCADLLSNVKHMFFEYHGLAVETGKLKELLSVFEKAGFAIYITTALDAIKKPFVEKRSVNDFDVQLNIFCYRI